MILLHGIFVKGDPIPDVCVKMDSGQVVSEGISLVKLRL